MWVTYGLRGSALSCQNMSVCLLVQFRFLKDCTHSTLLWRTFLTNLVFDYCSEKERSLMASIVSFLSEEKEVSLQKFFSRPVRFHLLYKSSHHGAQSSPFFSSFDKSGKFLLAVFLQSGSVIGAFMSKSLKFEKEVTDAEAFVFEINEHDAKQFPVLNAAKAITVCTQHASVQSSGFAFGGTTSFCEPSPTTSPSTVSISFGSSLKLKLDQSCWYANFQKDVTFGTTWPQENNICCVDVELHRVQDVGDLLPRPWREVSWNDETRENLRKDFISYKPLLKSLSQVKVLLLGPVGSGKSSLINSIRSTMYQRIVHLPNIGPALEGFTKKMTTYHMRIKQGGFKTALSFCDVMAVEEDDFTGVSYTDALAVIKGHVPEGYKFQRDVTVSDSVSGYIKDPTLNDRIHCVLFVLDASKVALYPGSMKSTFRKLHTTISDLGIPQLILLTHVDQICPAVEEDMKYVYSSRIVQDKMKKAAELVGLPLSYVLPVKNYVCQLTVDCKTDILLLSVVMSILQAVDDSLEDQYPVLVPLTPEKTRVEGFGVFD